MEKEIYEKLVIGDTTVFEQVFKETYKDAYLLAFSFMKKQEDAEDVLQDSYIKMFNNISKLQDADKFKSWFNQIIVNNCKNALKKSNRYALNFSDINDEDTDTDFEDSLVNEDETLNPEDVIDKTEITNIMAGIINSLPEEQSLCLQMFYYQDMKINDIASALDISENTVKSRLRIAKDKVSSKVEEFEKKNNIKLHSISLIPLFFKISVDNSNFPQLDFSKAVLPSLAAGTAGVSLAGTSTASSAITSAHTAAGVATTIASTTAKTVAAVATKKIIAIAVATAVTVTGVGVGAKQVAKKVYQKSNAESTSITQTVEVTSSVEDKEAVEKEIDKYELPEGYTIEIGGESDSMKQAFGDLILMIAMAIVFIYLIMVAQFQSLLSPFIVLFTIPLAFTGGFLALIITGFELNMISILGFLMLAGIVVNNGIVFVDYVNQLRLGGMKKKEALIEAGKARIRPILMTALTTILGLSTLAMGIGMGADMIQPMAIVTIGGLTYATVLTLFIVPIMYDILHRRELKPIIIEESI